MRRLRVIDGAHDVIVAPDSAEATVRAALAAHSITRPLATVPLVPVSGGLSNQAWRAQAPGLDCFVRLGGANAADLGVDRHSECRLLRLTADAGLSPPVIVCDPGRDLLVTGFVRGGAWRRQDVHEPHNLRRLGGMLRRLHELPVPAGLAQVSFERQARRLEAQLEPRGVADRGVCEIADRAFETLAAGPPRLAPCHNDLHHLNLLDDGERLWLVDWEYGGCGDPLFDLASFACQHESTPGERDALLTACGWNDGRARALLDAACTAFDYVQWLWYRLWVARGPDAAGEYAARAAAIHSRLLAVR
jgi:thiamine kinase-like enzyme